MTIKSEFETLIVCRDIIDERFEGGWRHWIEKFSMEDDGALSRASAMSGHDIARAERRVIKLGLRPPMLRPINIFTLIILFMLSSTAPIKIWGFHCGYRIG